MVCQQPGVKRASRQCEEEAVEFFNLAVEGSEANVTGGKGLERQGLVKQLLKAFGRQVSWGRKNRIFFSLACFFLGFALQLQCLCPGVNCSLCEKWLRVLVAKPAVVSGRTGHQPVPMQLGLQTIHHSPVKAPRDHLQRLPETVRGQFDTGTNLTLESI